MDLLTVAMHELAHVLGWGDTASGLMSEYLTAGVRLAAPVHVAAPVGAVVPATPLGVVQPAVAPASAMVAPANRASAALPAAPNVLVFANAPAVVSDVVAASTATGRLATGLISSSIMVAPTLFKLSAAHAVHSGSFVPFDCYFGWSGEASVASSAPSETSQVGDWAAP
jgi:hypothetical protein